MERAFDVAAVGLLATAVLTLYMIVRDVLPLLSMDDQMFFLNCWSNYRSRRFNEALTRISHQK
jgi:hypothetical protein